MIKTKKQTDDARKALEEKDAEWEDIHGISRDDHQRFLMAPYADFESNEEYALYMKMMNAKKKTEEEE